MRVIHCFLTICLGFPDDCIDANLYEECEAKCRVEYSSCRRLCETDYCLDICNDNFEICLKSCPCGEFCPEGCTGCENQICPVPTTTEKTTTTTAKPRIWFEKYDEELTMEGAQMFCEDQGGNLAFFRSQEEYDQYLRELPAFRQEHFGYRQVIWNSENDYFYRNTDGTNSTFDLFSTGRSQGRELCLFHDSPGSWSSGHCYTNRPFSCRFEEGSAEAPLSSKPKAVNFVQQKEKASMELAEFRCNQQGGHLAYFDTEEEWKEFKRLSAGLISEFIGVREGKNNKLYSSVSGNRESFLKWFPGEPNSPTLPCVIINYGLPGQLTDVHCYSEYHYTCRFEIN